MFKSENVADGVRVVCIETDKYKTAELDISMALPLDEKGAANALAIYLLKRSCKAYPDFTVLHGKLDELYGASLGASVGKYGDSQILSLGITCLDDKFSLDESSIIEEAIELLSGMLFNPNVRCKSFGKENFETEKRLMLQRILDEQDDKRIYATQQLIKNMFDGEPYGRNKYGTQEEINAVKMADVYQAWQNMLLKSRIQITCVGSIPAERVIEIFRKKFAKLQRTPVEMKSVFTPKAEASKRFEERLPMNQGKFVMGYRTGMTHNHDNEFAERIAVDIFGGGTYSKLFTVIREKMSLCYYCRATLVTGKGFVLVDCGIDTDKEEPATKGIMQQLEAVKNGDFEDDVLASSKRSLRERMTFSTPDGILSWYAGQITDEELRTPESMIENIEKVTKQEVMDCAAKMSLDTVFMLAADEPEGEKDAD